MARVLVAALVALLISILAGPAFVDFLRRHEFGQQIREEGPEHHSVKQGTPTMGGLLVVLAATIAFLATSDYTLPALTIFGTAVACGAIGFLDDWFKVRHRRSLGLNARWKMLLLLAISVAVGAMAIFLKVELLLLLVGGIFAIEALSVMLQVVSFKYWGRRVFLMAPLHHHFEMKAWSETKIMVRFWIVTGILCAAGFALFYKYYPQIRPSGL